MAGQKLRALVVEDSPDDLDLLVHTLQRSGYDVACARVDTAETMRTALESQTWDVILADYSLPRFSAPGALRVLQETGQDIPFIILSGAVSEETAVASLKAGAHDFMSKDRLARLAPAIERERGDAKTRRERREAEAALRRAEENYRNIFENAVDGICQITPEGRIITANPAMATKLGYDSPAQLMATVVDVRQDLYVNPSQRDKLVKALCANNVVRGFECRMRRKDGQVIWVSMSLRCVRDTQGTLLYHEGIVEEITERKRAEAALRRSNRRLVQALEDVRRAQSSLIQQERLRALGQMASGVAHDFNNALSPLLGFTDILLEGPLEKLRDKKRVIRYLQMMNTAARDARSIVNRLREFYRPRDASEEMFPVSIGDVVTRAVEMTRPYWKDQALARGLTVDVRCDLQPVSLVAGNESELREALTNLIVNAVDAMSGGGTLTISTGVSEGRVAVKVADTGLGMDEDVRRRCLEPFFSTKGELGSGMGLAMVYGIVERHNGALQIETSPGAGAAFTMLLHPYRMPHRDGASLALPNATQPLRVMVVDDDSLVLETMASLLREDGHQVEVACRGRDALEKLRGAPVDLLITNRAMPEMSGDQLARAVKRAWPDLPILMMTGFGAYMNAVCELPFGVDEVLSKPPDLMSMRSALARVATRRTAGRRPVVEASSTAPARDA